MLSQKFKDDAMRTLESMSAEEIISVLEKIGSVQTESISMDLHPIKVPKGGFSVQEDTEIAVEIELNNSSRYKFNLPGIEVLIKRGKAA